MKSFIKYILQKIMGFQTYLYVFALFVIFKLKWDKKEKDFFHFLKMLPGKGTVLDLGANIGVTSYHLAKALPDSTILSFEPLEVNMNVLKRIKKNFNLTNIQEYQMAAGNENTHLEMVMPVIHYVPMHGLSHVIHEDIKENNDGIRFKVPVVKLDEFNDLLTNGERVTGLKIDVENYEYFVLTGAKKILQKHRPLIYCELWENDNRQKCFSFLNELGYSAWVLHKRELVSFNAVTHHKHNFFFVPDSHNI